MKDYTEDTTFDQKSGVKIQNGKLEVVKKVIEAIERDLNNPLIDNYHSAAIATEVLYNYLGQDDRFYQDCKNFLMHLREHLNDKDTSESLAH